MDRCNDSHGERKYKIDLIDSKRNVYCYPYQIWVKETDTKCDFCARNGRCGFGLSMKYTGISDYVEPTTIKFLDKVELV